MILGKHCGNRKDIGQRVGNGWREKRNRRKRRNNQKMSRTRDIRNNRASRRKMKGILIQRRVLREIRENRSYNRR